MTDPCITVEAMRETAMGEYKLMLLLFGLMFLRDLVILVIMAIKGDKNA